MKAFIGRFTRSCAAAAAVAAVVLLLLLLELTWLWVWLEFVMLLFVLLVLLLVGVWTLVCGGEWALILPTEDKEGEDKDALIEEFRDVNVG